MPRRQRRRPIEVDKRDPFAELTRQIWAQPQVQAALDKLVDAAAARVERLPDDLLAAFKKEPVRISPPREPRPRPSAPPPPAPPPAPNPLLEARAALHFGPTEALDRRKIKERQRALARIAHSDVGGDKQAMQRINAAADTLLASLR